MIRNGKRMTVTATVGQRPPEDQLANFARQPQDDFSDQDQQSTKAATQDLIGIAVQPLTATIAGQLGVPASTKGVVISAVDPSSDAGQKGLRRGDVVLTANGQATLTEAELANAAKAAKTSGRNAVLLQVLRRGNPAAFIAVRLREQ